MLDEAFEALKKYDWGTDRAPVAPIDDAVAATHGKADARARSGNRLLAALKSDISRDAKDYVCRKLTIVGTAFRCRPWPACWPTSISRTWPASRWNAFPAAKRRKPCAMRCRS